MIFYLILIYNPRENPVMKKTLAIIISEFNNEITGPLLQGTLDRLKNKYKFSENSITIIRVPGAVEIPLAAKLLAKQDCYQAIICLGAVINGQTDHYRYVCEQVSQGCQQVMLECEIPLIFGVLTTQTVKQAKERIGGKHGHKGKDSADAAIQMIEICKKLKNNNK